MDGPGETFPGPVLSKLLTMEIVEIMEKSIKTFQLARVGLTPVMFTHLQGSQLESLMAWSLGHLTTVTTLLAQIRCES